MDVNERSAWQQWLERCAIVRCDMPLRTLLGKSVKRAMQAKLNRISSGKTLPPHYLNFFDSWFCQRKKGDSEAYDKPYKQFIIERAVRQNDSLEKTVYGCILGAEQFTLVRKLLEDSYGLYGHRLEPLSNEDDRPVNEGEECLVEEDVEWAIQKIVENFLKFSTNKRRDYERLASFFDAQLDYKHVAVSKSTFYEQRDKAQLVLKRAICDNEEAKLICFAYGEVVLKSVLTKIRGRIEGQRYESE